MSKHNNPIVVGILLVYYEKYALSAIREFTKLIRSVTEDAKIIVVSNNSFLGLPTDDDIIRVAGDNSLREFSGWDKGISTARNFGLLNNSRLVIFANDTYCHHNSYGIYTRHRFRAEFRKNIAGEQDLSLVGEKFTLGYQASISGLTFNSWISTYLFGVTTQLLFKLGQLSPTFTIEQVFRGSEDSQSEMTELVSRNLSRYIESWLGMRDGSSGRWYGVQDGTAMSMEQYRGKAGAILCEKSLSASCENVGGKLIDVFPLKTGKLVRRFERFLTKHR